MGERKDEDEDDSIILREDMTKDDDEEEFGGKDGMMERCCGIGRVWIFLVLGMLILVFTAVLTGVYMNVRSVTSSMEHLEVVPSILPAAVSGLAGLIVLSLFWRRYKILVYGAMMLCAGATILCAISAVLTGTHVLQAILSVSACVYNRQDRVCRCSTQFRRQGLGVEKVAKEDSEYLTMKGILSCDDVHAVLPGLLFTMVGIYGVVSLVCLVAGVISLLVYRTEKWRKCLQQVECEDQYISSPHQPCSDNCAEHQTMLPTQPASKTNATTLVNIYTNPRATGNDDNSTNDDGNTTPSDLIYSPADIPMGYAEACRMRRCQSFSQPRRGTLRDGSPVSSTSSQAISFTGRDKNLGGAVRGQGQLKEHRKRGRRAVTLHGLDREQLLLILSLQMRYLQESDQSAKREGSRHMHNNLITDSNQENVDDDVADSSQENDDDNVIADSTQENVESSFTQLQRRAMTPTARQECLPSSLTTSDDLDYKPAKLIRSQTPQPYHFKSTHENNPALQNLPQHQIHPHFPHQPQPPSQIRNNDEDEPPTLITYDLRNITKAGPLVYENSHTARNSLSCCSPRDSCSSNNSSLTCSLSNPTQPKLTPGLRPIASAQTSPNRMSQDKNKTLGANIQEFENLKKQFLYQTSQASISSQSDFENSTSDTRRLIPSEEKLKSEKKLAKNKFSNKEKKECKTESEQTACDRSSGLCRTDSNSSKSGTVPDRWKTLMENGTRNTQTLWENVQKKPLSDLQSELEHHPLTSNYQTQTSASQAGCCDIPKITNCTPKHSTSLPPSSPELSQGISLPQIAQTLKLINSSATTDRFIGTRGVPPNLSQNFAVSQNQNPNTARRTAHNAYHENVFVPISDSSIENFKNIDSMSSQGQQQQPPFLSSDQTTGNMNELSAPPKPPRFNGRYMGRFDHSPNVVQIGSDCSDQQLKFKDYTNNFDQIGKENFFNPSNSGENFSKSINSSSYPWNNYMKTIPNKQTERSFSDAETRHDSVRSVQRGIHYQPENGDMYTHPRRKSNPNTGVAMVTPDYSPLQIHQNVHKYSGNSGQLTSNKQRQNLHRSVSVLYPQKSAFHTLGHGPNSDSYLSHDRVPECGRWDTDLDNLPAPHRQRQSHRSELISPYSVHQSLDSVARFPLARSGSTSSSEPHNASYTSSETSATAFVDPRGGPPHVIRDEGHSGGQRQARFPSKQPGYPVDHRYDVQQYHQQQHYNLQQQQHLYNLQQQQQGYSTLGKEKLYVKDKVQIQNHRQPHVNIRRCQSMEERRRTQPFLQLSRRRNSPYQQDNAGVFYRNISALNAEKSIRNGEAKILNSGIPSLDAHGNEFGSSCDRMTLQKGQQVFQGCPSSEGQKRSIPTEPSLLFKKVPANEIAGYVGVVKLVDSSDSDDFAETVI